MWDICAALFWLRVPAQTVNLHPYLRYSCVRSQPSGVGMVRSGENSAIRSAVSARRSATVIRIEKPCHSCRITPG